MGGTGLEPVTSCVPNRKVALKYLLYKDLWHTVEELCLQHRHIQRTCLCYGDISTHAISVDEI